MDFKLLDPPHQGLINDIAFDYYGKRFATCSNDKHLKIWSLDEDKGTWVCDDIPRAHSDSIWRLSWAHPEFGQVIASCSEDCSVRIWEEQESGHDSTQGRWLKKAQIGNNRSKSINDVKFCHHNLGLKIATASADGYVRVYQAKDIFDLREWDLLCEERVEDTTNDSKSADQKPKSEHGLTCLSWNDCPFEAARVAVGGYSKRAVVLKVEESRLTEECVLDDHANPVSDVAWAPAMGRSFHLIATASRESCFRIHTLKRKEGGKLERISTEKIDSAGKGNIWRLSWNATGTLLAASSEDGSISLWRKNFAGTWVNVQNIPSENKMNYYYQNP